MCEEMRRERGPIMKTFGFEWSDSIDCNQLPQKSVQNHLCIPHPSYDSQQVEDDPKSDEKFSHTSSNDLEIFPIKKEASVNPEFKQNKQKGINLPIEPVVKHSLDIPSYGVIPPADETLNVDYGKPHFNEDYKYAHEGSLLIHSFCSISNKLLHCSITNFCLFVIAVKLMKRTVAAGSNSMLLLYTGILTTALLLRI